MSATPETGPSPVTVATLRSMKASGSRIVMVTAYDAPSARLAEEAGVDVILVGDSLGMTVLGFDSTLPVTMDDMVRHTAAVVRGASRALVVADMPFLSFQVSPEDALRNAGRLLAEGGAAVVKVEGGRPVAPTVARLVTAGIPVVGHVGLTPQSVNALGGYRLQAKGADTAIALRDDCLALQDAGACAIVLELVPGEVAALVSRSLDVPTIGIGAGPGCDGQVQVFHDILGLGVRTPRHATRFAEVGEAVRAGIAAYADAVREGAFPGEANYHHADPAVVDALSGSRDGGE
ncbi:MAG: 3-methyl-2-oxobutanoate hydroxymethyltransferase [Coriobacteriia bacterium]